jgi:transcriptional regulator with XRE-family HTH domain
MKERIIEFLKKENKTSAQFAEEIGVQPSGISHILSGRNKPSLDFVIKMLEKYNYISSDWLIFGKGKMYRDAQQPDLFSYLEPEEPENKQIIINKPAEIPLLSPDEAGIQEKNDRIQEKINSRVIKIVWFYDDDSFKEYSPRNE